MLGGGAAGLAAAFELTHPKRECAYDVTVYTLGWRLGGKGASGRNEQRGQRIEEHGLHMWFGFYRNAFRMMRDVFDELGAASASPFGHVSEAFTPCHQLVLWDRQWGGWAPMTIPGPERDGTPWDDAPLPQWWQVAEWLLDLLQRGLVNSDTEPKGGPAPVPSRALGILAKAQLAAVNLIGQSARATIGAVRDLAGDLFGAREDVEEHWREWLRSHPKLLLAYSGVDLLAALVNGLAEDNVFENGLDSINEEDLRDWLRRHGASQLSIGETFEESSPILRAIYDVAFLFPNGHAERASAAAGTAINDFLRLVGTYRGALYYKMEAGMGDAIFAPLYQLLAEHRECKVEFSFFSEVEALHLDASKQRIASIDLVPQAQLVPPRTTYDPLIDVKGVPSWPNEPVWKQLDELRVDPPRYETHPNRLKPIGRKKTLVLGEDFDYVVLAIPVGALGSIATELVEAQPERFGDMVNNATTVATQAFQVWLDRTSADLGGPNHSGNVSATFVEPLDTYCDMSHLIPLENWDQVGVDVEAIGYFCGALPDIPGPESHEDATQRVRDGASDFLSQHAGWLWPNAYLGGPGAPIDWEVLVDPHNRSGEDRFEYQYWRANTSDWERYVSTPAGSVQFRRAPGESGFANLVLAGDWTKNGIDGGCVEAAVLSGLQAAQAIISPGTPFDGDQGDKWLDPPQ